MIFPAVARHALTATGLPDERNPIRHYRADGRYWGRSDASSVHLTIDTVQLLLETSVEDKHGLGPRFLLIWNAENEVWSLPEAIATEDPGAGNDWDSGNHIGCMASHMHEAYGLEVPWMSWLDDTTEEQRSIGKFAQRMCRVYAHRLDHTIPNGLLQSESSNLRWVTAGELGALPRSSLRHAGLETRWATMWTTETDVGGQRVMRGFGVANHRMRHLRFQAPPDRRGDGVEADIEGRYIVNAASLQAVARM